MGISASGFLGDEREQITDRGTHARRMRWCAGQKNAHRACEVPCIRSRAGRGIGITTVKVKDQRQPNRSCDRVAGVISHRTGATSRNTRPEGSSSGARPAGHLSGVCPMGTPS